MVVAYRAEAKSLFETKEPSHLKPDLQSIDDNWVVCELGSRNGKTGSDQSRERR